MITPSEGLSNSHYPATLNVGDRLVTSFLVDAVKLEQFMMAAEVLERTTDSLIAEAVDLCLDTSIAKAIHKLG